MKRRIRQRMQCQKGFTLVELLVVMAIIGILAAIGLPAFLGEQAKGHDGAAKSNARNVVSAIESCFAETRSYEDCDSSDDFDAADTKPGVELTDIVEQEKGAVAVEATEETFSVTGYSESDNAFVIAKDAEGTFTRSCTTGGSGGCKSGDVW